MKQVHNQEKEQFKALFTQEKIDRFEDRFRILEAFLQTERHITAGELSKILGGDPGVAFTGETLELLCQFGFATKNRFDSGEVRYEHRHLGQHHDHMICTKCGGISEFRDERLERLQMQIAAEHGFHMVQHRMELYGLCRGCLSERVPRMPLTSVKPGERLVIREITGGAGARMRLMSMGLRAGDDIEVISNLNQGQVVVAVDAKRYILGKGLAQKILVERGGSPEDAALPGTTACGENFCMRMSEMREGQKGIICRVRGGGAVRRRLLEMGLVRGAEFTVEKYAPLRDPMEIIVKGYHVSLRVEEAAQINVSDVS